MDKTCRWLSYSLLLFIALLLIVLYVSTTDQVIQDQNTSELPILSQESHIFAIYSDGSEVVAAYQATDSGLVSLSKDEYAQHLESAKAERATKALVLQGKDRPNKPAQPSFPQAQPSFPTTASQGSNFVQGSPFVGAPLVWYKELGHNEHASYTGFPMFISNRFLNSTNNSASFFLATVTTQDTLCSIPLGYFEKYAIANALGMKLSISRAAQVGQSIDMASKYTTWIEFYPTMYNTWGHLCYGVSTQPYPGYVVSSTTLVDVYLPKLLSSNLLDGIYEVKQAKRVN